MKLQHQRLLALWDYDTYGKGQSRKDLDGLFIFKSLFSVGAFATRKNPDIMTELAKRTSDKLITQLKVVRQFLRTQNATLIADCDDLEINQRVPTTPTPLPIDDSKLTPESTLWIKVFLTCDDYFVTLYKANKNGELTSSQYMEHRQEAIRAIRKAMQHTHTLCSSFHKVRKKHQQVRG